MPDPIHVQNAGLVLTSPFLPRFFEQLDMLQASKQWLNPAAAARGVRLLQYLVDGAGTAPDRLLALNKMMCGLAHNAPIEASFVATAQEQRLCDQLLSAIIANWTAVSNTSIAGLRETFLQREGTLAGDRLVVQRKTLDVLVDQIPWSFSIVRLPWMTEPLSVRW